MDVMYARDHHMLLGLGCWCACSWVAPLGMSTEVMAFERILILFDGFLQPETH